MYSVRKRGGMAAMVVATVAATVAVAACARGPQGPTYEEIVSSYVGRQEADLVSAWGVPVETHRLTTGGQVLEYQKYSGSELICTTRFTVGADGRIAKTWYKGRYCART